MKRNKQKGFTIIELVVVILLLGILTATALPRFMDVTDDAHGAVVNAVEAGLRTSVALYHAEWIAGNQPNTVTSYTLKQYNGYPTGATGGPTPNSTNSMTTSAMCEDIYEALLQEGRPSIANKATAATALTTIFSTTGDDADFIAYVRNTDGSRKLCKYAYTGQYTSTSVGTIPVITYDTTTGIVAREEL
jgi:MSHA pilin protein MshB